MHDRPPGDNVISLFGGARSAGPTSPEKEPESTPPSRSRGERTPLRQAPEAPRFTDPRQSVGRSSLGKGTAQTGRRNGGSVMYNFTSGMGASSVNLGQLQTIIETILADITLPELTARWNDDVSTAVQDALLEWVQRVDHFELELHESGVRVSLQTQDDFGYYHYAFDAFPERGDE